MSKRLVTNSKLTNRQLNQLIKYFTLEVPAARAAKAMNINRQFYLRLLHRRGAQKAKVAVARKLLIRGYVLLRDRIDYTEFLSRGVEARLARLAT